MKLYRITRLVKDKLLNEFLVANHIQDVINDLELDLKDGAVEITAIVEEVPVTKVL